MGKWILALALGLSLSGVMRAQDKPLKLDVGGDIVIDPQGAVRDYEINTPLAPEVKKIVDQAVRKWQFNPVVRGGKPVAAKTSMFLSLLATPVGKGYQLRIDRVRFGGGRAVVSQRNPAQYPRQAFRAGIGAEVVAAVRIDAEGNVLDVLALQSRLLNTRKGRDDAAMRKLFEQSTVDAFRTWKYRPADLKGGELADTTLLVTTKFCTGDCKGRGEWQVADAIERAQPVPWLAADRQAFDVNEVRPGQSITLDGPVRLKDFVEGKTL